MGAKRALPFIVSVPAVVSVASAVYDQVSQLVPVQQVDDIDEVHQLDPVHQVDHKDDCSKISCKEDTIRWTNQGSKKYFFHFFLKSRGHFEGHDFKPFVILARVLVDFKVVFGRLFSDIWKLQKTVKAGFWRLFSRDGFPGTVFRGPLSGDRFSVG